MCPPGGSRWTPTLETSHTRPGVPGCRGAPPSTDSLGAVPRDPADRLLASALLYAQAASVDLDAVAARLIELTEGVQTALGRAHKRAVLGANKQPDDQVTRRALQIVRRALERVGSC
jgi:hypothetical protein